MYNTFLKPCIAKHEKEVDRNLLRMKNRSMMIATLLWQKAARYGQTKFFEILQCASSQSASRSQPTNESRKMEK